MYKLTAWFHFSGDAQDVKHLIELFYQVTQDKYRITIEKEEEK
jgi:hypothetical protein